MTLADRLPAAPQALADGRVSAMLVDGAVARVLRMKLELGLFEAPYVDPGAAQPAFADDAALAREAARAYFTEVTVE